MNFGASHLVQTSALLKKDSKRQGVLTLHAAPKGLAECYSSDIHSSPRSEVSKSIWGLLPEESTLLVEQAYFRQYEAAAGVVIEQLREALEFSAEDLLRHKSFKQSFESFLDTYKRTRSSRRQSFLLLEDVINSVLASMFTYGARTATSDFCDQQAVRLMRAYIHLKQEQELLNS